MTIEQVIAETHIDDLLEQTKELDLNEVFELICDVEIDDLMAMTKED